MKKAAFHMLLLCAVMAACDDNNDDKKYVNIQLVEKTLSEGQWRITYFFQSGSDQTVGVSGYIFEFDDNNIVTASDGLKNYAGTWSVSYDDSTDDDNDPYADVDLNISFTSPPEFVALSEDWLIVNLSDTKLALEHVNGVNGETDLVTFERI